MEEFFKKYGVQSEHQFFSHVSSDPVFAMRVASDYFEEKFPRKVVEEKVIMHPDHPDADPPRVIAPAEPVEGDVVMHPDYVAPETK